MGTHLLVAYSLPTRCLLVGLLVAYSLPTRWPTRCLLVAYSLAYSLTCYLAIPQVGGPTLGVWGIWGIMGLLTWGYPGGIRGALIGGHPHLPHPRPSLSPVDAQLIA